MKLVSRLRAAGQRISLALERLYDFRASATRTEFLAVQGAAVLFFILLAAAAIGHIVWIASWGAQFDFADELQAALFTPWRVLGYLLYALCATCGVVCVLVAQTFCAIRRLNDLELSRWLVLLGLVPVANVVLLVFLAFTPSRDASQRVLCRERALEAEVSA